MSQGKRSAGEEPAIAALPCGVESLWRLSAAGRSRQKNAPRDRRRLAHGTCQTFTEGRGTTAAFFFRVFFLAKKKKPPGGAGAAPPAISCGDRAKGARYSLKPGCP